MNVDNGLLDEVLGKGPNNNNNNNNNKNNKSGGNGGNNGNGVKQR